LAAFERLLAGGTVTTMSIPIRPALTRLAESKRRSQFPVGLVGGAGTAARPTLDLIELDTSVFDTARQDSCMSRAVE
jgi:hypothetical protein